VNLCIAIFLGSTLPFRAAQRQRPEKLANQQRSASFYNEGPARCPAGIRAVSSSRPARDAVPSTLVRACCSLLVGLDIFASPAVPAALHRRPRIPPFLKVSQLLASPSTTAPAAIAAAAALVFSLIFTSSPGAFVAVQHADSMIALRALIEGAKCTVGRATSQRMTEQLYSSIARGSMPQVQGNAPKSARILRTADGSIKFVGREPPSSSGVGDRGLGCPGVFAPPAHQTARATPTRSRQKVELEKSRGVWPELPATSEG
jgi:hypothetical protein